MCPALHVPDCCFVFGQLSEVNWLRTYIYGHHLGPICTLLVRPNLFPSPLSSVFPPPSLLPPSSLPPPSLLPPSSLPPLSLLPLSLPSPPSPPSLPLSPSLYSTKAQQRGKLCGQKESFDHLFFLEPSTQDHRDSVSVANSKT